MVMGGKGKSYCWLSLCLLGSTIVNIYFLSDLYIDGKGKVSWSEEGAAKAEEVASIYCSNHGRAYLDGVIGEDGKPVCECHTCYAGSDCSLLLPHCAADVDRGAHGSRIDGYGSEPQVSVLKISEPEPNCEGVLRLWFRFQNRRFRFWFRTGGFPTVFHSSKSPVFGGSGSISQFRGDPLFLEPFWMHHASSSAVLISGWHRMSYSFPGPTPISEVLDSHIRRIHHVAKNALTDGKYIVFGAGSTQLLNAAVYALSANLSSPASVVASAPFYPIYKSQTDFFQNENYAFKGEASLMSNASYANTNVIEFVTSPNNPDGNLKEAVCKGPNVRAIYDHAYFWPHFTAIPSPADEDVMIFTMSKLTGHAGSRFGWALVKDEEVYNNMMTYISVAEIGISRETQLRALQLMKAILRGDGKEIFDYAFEKMSDRWGKISRVFSKSKRFSIQEIPPLYCNFFDKVRGPSPGYAWVKCEREEDLNCTRVLGEANIIGRAGSRFSVADRHVRLSLLKGDDDFNLLLNRLETLVDEEGGPEAVSSF